MENKFNKVFKDIIKEGIEKGYSSRNDNKGKTAWCRKCRKNYERNFNFCPECGQKLQKWEDRRTQEVNFPFGYDPSPFCPQCHIIYDGDVHYCEECGHALCHRK